MFSSFHMFDPFNLCLSVCLFGTVFVCVCECVSLSFLFIFLLASSLPLSFFSSPAFRLLQCMCVCMLVCVCLLYSFFLLSLSFFLLQLLPLLSAFFISFFSLSFSLLLPFQAFNSPPLSPYLSLPSLSSLHTFPSTLNAPLALHRDDADHH